VILTIVVPVQTILTPLYMTIRSFDVLGIIKLINGAPLNLLRTLWPMILMSGFGMGIRSGLYIYIFRQFFRGLPKELEEAALIDGAGAARTYLTVMLPNAVPAIITVAMFSMVWQYNDTYFLNTFMAGHDFISNRIANVAHAMNEARWIRIGGWASQENEQFVNMVTNAAMLLGMAPIALLYFIMQRYFIEGIERSGIVG